MSIVYIFDDFIPDIISVSDKIVANPRDFDRFFFDYVARGVYNWASGTQEMQMAIIIIYRLKHYRLIIQSQLFII